MTYVVEHSAWYTNDAEQMNYRSIHVCSLHRHLCMYYVYIKYAGVSNALCTHTHTYVHTSLLLITRPNHRFD